MKKNNYRLVPGTINYWGDILGNIEEQKDLIEYISTHGGGGTAAVWGSISGNISNQSDLMETLSSYALLSDIPSLEGYATESWVSAQGYLTSETIPSDIATQSWVESHGYLTSVPSGYATESWVSAQGFITSIPSEYATQSWVESQGYLTSVPSGYATESWVESQNYITSEALSGYATESWVSAQGFITSIPSEYATQSWVESQSYVSVGDNNLAPLFSKSDGYLNYKLLISSKSNKWVPSGGANGTYGSRAVFNINGDIINFTYRSTTYGGNGMIYKFNFDTLTFDELIQGHNYPNSELPMWTDNTGRVYYGVTYTVDLTTGEFTPWDAGTGVSSDFKVYQNSLNNIVKFNGSIYLIPGDQTYAYKFNESTQQFEQTLTLSGISDVNWLRYKGYYNGKVLYLNNSVLYELKETVESDVVTGLYFEEVTTPYFPLTFYNVETEQDTEIKMQQVFEITVNNETEYVFWAASAGGHVYQLVDGVWIPIPGFTMVTASGTSSGAIQGDMMFGYGYGPADNILVWNFGDTKESYGWDTSLSSVDSRLSSVESSVTDLNINMGSIDTRLSKVELRLSNLEDNLPYDNNVYYLQAQRDGSGTIIYQWVSTI